MLVKTHIPIKHQYSTLVLWNTMHVRPTLVFAPHQPFHHSAAHTLFDCTWEVCEQQDGAKWTSGHGEQDGAK